MASDLLKIYKMVGFERHHEAPMQPVQLLLGRVTKMFLTR